MDLREFYDSTFEQFLKFMKPVELESLIREMGLRYFNNDMIQNDDYRSNILWTRNGNVISSYDIYPSDLTFYDQESAERFIDTLNSILDSHPGYIDLNEFYEAYNNQITMVWECLVLPGGVSISKIITNPVDTVIGFLVDRDTRIDKGQPTEGITKGDRAVIGKQYPDNQYHISFDTPVDISNAKVAYVHSMQLEEKSK